jgi:hypothetical protein
VVLAHDAVHLLRRLSFFTGPEWEVLSNASRDR